MEINISKEMTKEILGHCLYIGSTTKYGYDRVAKRRTEDVIGTNIELASEKLGRTINVFSTETALELSAFTSVEMLGMKYTPYAKVVSANFAELVESFQCEKIIPVDAKGAVKPNA